MANNSTNSYNYSLDQGSAGATDERSGLQWPDVEDHRTGELYAVLALLGFLALTGTAGNLLVLYVFSQKKDKLVSTLFILVLAFVDFTTCMIVIPYTMYMEYMNFFISSDFFCKLYQFLITSNIPFSALVMVAIAIDRYFCICHPFLHALNLQRAKIMITCLALFAAAIGVMVALMYGVYQEIDGPFFNNLTSSLKNDTEANVSDVNYDGNTTAPMETRIVMHSQHPDRIMTHTVAYDFSQPVPSIGENETNNNSMYFPDIQAYPEYGEHEPIYSYRGQCQDNGQIVNQAFLLYFQKCYTALYLLCLIIVIILYTLIYRSVLVRRTRRQKQKSKSLHMVQIANERANGDSTCTEETLLTTVNGDPKDGGLKNGGKVKDKDKYRRKSTKKDKNRIANLKTAAMLFVVTVVFIVTFLPAFLMALRLIPNNNIIFYMYFANNVANPVIYAFMNKNFRDDLHKLFCRGR